MTPGETARLSLLIPECGTRVQQVIAAMGARGLAVYVGQTMRTQAEQDATVARGTSSVHQARSWHQLGRAADLRKRNTDGSVDETTHDESFFRALYEEAIAVGLRSLAYHVVNGQIVKLLIHTTHGDVWDAGHVEYREPYATLDEAFAAEGGDVRA